MSKMNTVKLQGKENAMYTYKDDSIQSKNIMVNSSQGIYQLQQNNNQNNNSTFTEKAEINS